jgi:hypothetical protein
LTAYPTELDCVYLGAGASVKYVSCQANKPATAGHAHALDGDGCEHEVSQRVSRELLLGSDHLGADDVARDERFVTTLLEADPIQLIRAVP